jgi:hypothetical protein
VSSDLALRVAVGDGVLSCLEVGQGLASLDLAGFDQRRIAVPGDAHPSSWPAKSAFFAMKGNWAYQVFNPV